MTDEIVSLDKSQNVLSPKSNNKVSSRLGSIQTDFEKKEVKVLNIGETFGEISLIEEGSKTTAIVDTKEICEFACMDKK